MTNEEFQKIVLEELREIKSEQRQMKEELRQMNKDIKSVIKQTADLTEFREETNAKLDLIIEENDILKELIGKHEVDIRRLQRRII